MARAAENTRTISGPFTRRPPAEASGEQFNPQDNKRITMPKNPHRGRLNVDQTGDNAQTTQGKLDTYLPNTVRDGHAVALVGYTADRFIVRNSWDTTA
jgi:hypothetical protein